MTATAAPARQRHEIGAHSVGPTFVVNDRGGAMDGTGDDRTAAELVVDEIRAMGGEAVATRGQVGGGSLPGATLDSWGVAVRPPPGMSTAELHAALRRGRPPVVARLEKERLILDLKAVFPEEDALLSARLLETLT